MKLEAFLIGFVIFSAFIVGGVFIMADLNNNYSDIMTENISTSNFNGTYNVIDEMYNLSQDQKDQVIGAELSDTNIAETSYKGTFSAIRLVSNTFKLLGNIINDLANIVGIPSFFVKFALTALTIAIIFAIIGIVLRFKE